MELTPDAPQPEWSDPIAAYAEYKLGRSPYVHYWFDLRGPVDGAPVHGENDGADIPAQMAESLRILIRQGLG